MLVEKVGKERSGSGGGGEANLGSINRSPLSLSSACSPC